MSYTVGMRETGTAGPFVYIARDLKVVDHYRDCTPLTREQAQEAARRLRVGARRQKRPS